MRINVYQHNGSLLLKLLIIAMAITHSSISVYGKEIVVMEKSEGVPIIGAALISNTGHIESVTNINGVANMPNNIEYPVTIKSLGYEIFTLNEPTDTVFLNIEEFELPEISYIASERPIKRVLCYAKEYITGFFGDVSMQALNECMLESFVVDDKVKGYHSYDADFKTRNGKEYVHLRRDNKKDTLYMSNKGSFMYINQIELPTIKIKETKAMREGASVDSIPGKYCTKSILNKSSNRYNVFTDLLNIHKHHKWSPNILKLLGLTTDFNQMDVYFSFQQNESGEYDIYDLLYASVNIDVLARGKWFKKMLNTKEPIKLKSYIEIYPVDIISLTLEEYKEMRSNTDPIDFQFPKKVLQEIPAVTDLKKRVLEAQELNTAN